jgi:ABC-type transporter Mla subunit MlaD
MANKPKISDEDLETMQAEDRHVELIRSLEAIADHSGVDELVKTVSALADAVERQKPTESTTIIDLAPITKELSARISELKAVMEKRPKKFIVSRDDYGRITEVVPKY